MATTPVVTTDYRVTSISEAGNDAVNVTFAEVVAEGNTTGTPSYNGSFSRTFSSADGAGFFPGQVYTLTLTKKATSTTTS